MIAGPGATRGRSLHVVELTQRYPPALGGVERHVADLSTYLHQAGVAVEVVTSDLYRDRPILRLGPGGDPNPFPVRRHHAFRGFVAPHGLGVAAPGMILDALRVRRGVLHAHAFGYPPTWIGRLAQKMRGLPLVVTPHFDGSHGSRLYAKAVTRGTLARADRVIALTQREAKMLTALGVDRTRIRVIPNGICPDDFLPISLPRPFNPKVTILYVGRVDLEQKGLEDLLRAVACLRRLEGVSVRLVGEDWGGARTLLALARRLGIDRTVLWTGALSLPELRREYASADIFVLPSRLEPFGIVLLEAMAAGLPVVATRVGGIPEVIDEGADGYLVPPGDPPELARALDLLIGDPSLRQRFGEHGRAHVRQFSWSILLPKFLDLFRELEEGQSLSMDRSG